MYTLRYEALDEHHIMKSLEGLFILKSYDISPSSSVALTNYLSIYYDDSRMMIKGKLDIHNDFVEYHVYRIAETLANEFETEVYIFKGDDLTSEVIDKIEPTEKLTLFQSIKKLLSGGNYGL